MRLNNLIAVIGTISGAMALASTASAEVFISCTPISGNSPWLQSVYRIEPDSIQTWDPSSGWKANECISNSCSFSSDAYVLQWRVVDRGTTAYDNIDYTLTFERRTGVISLDYKSEKFGLDGRPDPYGDVWYKRAGRVGYGTCKPTESPALAKPVF